VAYLDSITTYFTYHSATFPLMAKIFKKYRCPHALTSFPCIRTLSPCNSNSLLPLSAYAMNNHVHTCISQTFYYCNPSINTSITFLTTMGTTPFPMILYLMLSDNSIALPFSSIPYFVQLSGHPISRSHSRGVR